MQGFPSQPAADDPALRVQITRGGNQRSIGAQRRVVTDVTHYMRQGGYAPQGHGYCP